MQARDWLPIVERYAAPVAWRSACQLATTLALLVGLYAAMFALAAEHYPLVLALAVPTACAMVRGFSIQHDCQHGAYFASRWLETWVGRALCLVTLVPNGHHRRMHAVHHAATGRLDKRRAQPGSFPRTAADFDLITVAEFRALPRRARRLYRFLRDPLVIFTVVPLYLFLFSYRVPVLHPTSRGRGWISTQGTNLALAGALGLGVALAGATRLFAVLAPTMICYVTIGVWLFYVQHQFEHTSWRGRDWDYREAALHGSSYLALPRPLQWLTGNIGIHHVHHLCPAIPNYRLADCLRDHPALAQVSRVGVADSLRMLRLALWDEDRGELVAFSASAP